jgi:hypothetical protein
MKNLTIIIFTLISIGCKSQDVLEPRTVEYYFEQLKNSSTEYLKNANALNDSLQLKNEYFETINGKRRFNDKGISIYTESRMNAHKKIFSTWNYQNHITKENYTYVLYFSIAGFEDLEWKVVRFKKDKWNNQEALNKKELKELAWKIEDNEIQKDSVDFIPIFFNWDEGPKNTENVKLFIKNDYLVLERGNLYHSLYDLKTQETIINIECPWCSSDAKDKDSMNDWIKVNLHDKIEEKLNENRK